MNITEDRVHMAFARYVKLKYKDVIFTSDLSGIILDWNSAKKAAKIRSSDKIPDMIFFEPRGGWHGLLVEIKKGPERVYLKDGSLSKAKHIQGQKKMLDALTSKGYCAIFGVGLDGCIELFDKYMNGEIKRED